ncbi:hypothetical protein V8E36_008655 [Tilletia maclaganii]
MRHPMFLVLSEFHRVRMYVESTGAGNLDEGHSGSKLLLRHLAARAAPHPRQHRRHLPPSDPGAACCATASHSCGGDTTSMTVLPHMQARDLKPQASGSSLALRHDAPVRARRVRDDDALPRPRSRRPVECDCAPGISFPAAVGVRHRCKLACQRAQLLSRFLVHFALATLGPSRLLLPRLTGFTASSQAIANEVLQATG